MEQPDLPDEYNSVRMQCPPVLDQILGLGPFLEDEPCDHQDAEFLPWVRLVRADMVRVWQQVPQLQGLPDPRHQLRIWANFMRLAVGLEAAGQKVGVL